jgi:type II secretory pathway pseudopilin PulG
MPPRSRSGLNSFSLVEVVIAIAVTSFVLVSILGLMAYASQTVQQSDKYARLATVASQALAIVASKPFARGPYGLANNSSGSGVLAPVTNYYTSEGLPTNAAYPQSYYQCIIADATTNPATGVNIAKYPLKDAGGALLMEPIQISIRWPSPVYNNTNIIVSSILNYD